MASSISALKISKWQYILMKSIALNQPLPTSLATRPNSLVILIEQLISQGYVIADGHQLSLSKLGKIALVEHVGGKIPLIDIDSRWLLAESDVPCDYVVGSSLARQLAKRVSLGK